MATYSTGYSTSNQAFTPQLNGEMGVREVTFTVDTALALNDVIEMLPVYSGERILGIELISDDLDSGGTAIVLDIGDGASTARFIDGSTAAQGGGTDSAIVSYTYAADDTIDILVQVGPTTGATSVDCTLRMIFVRG